MTRWKAMPAWLLITKRSLDILLSISAVFLLTPLLIVVGLFIKFQSPGGIFFKQTRVGLHGKPFDLYKFRTMDISGVTSAASTTLRDDKRIFPGGAFLRRYKIDELPQVINILVGDMSVVGPRPTVSADFERMNEEQRKRVSVKPGLTGLAQVSGNTELSWPDRIRLDLCYISKLSLFLDIKLIFITVFQVVSGRADTHPKTDDEWRDE